MSTFDCSQCPGCGPQTVAPTQSPTERLATLLQTAESQLTTPSIGITAESDDHDWIELICQELSQPVYSSYTALARLAMELQTQRQLSKFLQVARGCLELNLRGHLLAWAWDYAQQDSERFMQLVLSQDTGMVEYIHGQAEWFELVNGLSVGRCRVHANPNSTLTKSDTP
ncbi:hypothetical protein IWQ62_000236 [Dispira parvispora]|uniref:Uncharacterized protein n=1 Tax=Dispira parvispora TaxID=1520584 RepID=A0A9W8B0J2_9FUNG|nr:hypothetical protein IWQ62_000236 [Dispira parvispora]